MDLLREPSPMSDLRQLSSCALCYTAAHRHRPTTCPPTKDERSGRGSLIVSPHGALTTSRRPPENSISARPLLDTYGWRGLHHERSG